MPRLSAIQKAICESILRAWLHRGHDIRHLGLAVKKDLYEVKTAIEDCVLLFPAELMTPMVMSEMRQYGHFDTGFTLRWPAIKAQDKGFAAVPPVPLSLLEGGDPV